MSQKFNVTALSLEEGVVSTLADLLIETVANGGSVSFMHPLDRQQAIAFWEASLAAAGRGDRVVLGAFEGEDLIGTVTLLLDCPQNQPHRAEIAKMMTRLNRRGQGVASALMMVAEHIAIKRGRSLLTLDTATDGGAAALYEKLGFYRAGEIPGYAFKPEGGLTGTIIYWKKIGEVPK
jgi:ribosomal protein S18 acetylase RimI-like enzyme